MINTNILSSVFKNYGIHDITLVVENDTYNFIISNMTSTIAIDRWKYLEDILKDITKKKINLIPLNQALKYLGEDYINKGVEIKWKKDIQV